MSISVAGRIFQRDAMTNLASSILPKVSSGLLQQPGHPLARIKEKIYRYFQEQHNFHIQDMPDPIVTVQQNFDELGFPADHVGRSPHDSYYINKDWMLRTHMTANERQLLRQGRTSFLMAGSVFRRDEIDATHYPAFHQLEGVHIFDNVECVEKQHTEVEGWAGERQPCHSLQESTQALFHLQTTLNGLLKNLFGDSTPIRWQSCTFPFTDPSLEVEVWYRDRWIEVLGSGLLQDAFLRGSGLPGRIAWAFGLGLERLAMVLYDIPDIRLFWSQDPRFLSQFDPIAHPLDAPIRFKPFSRYPPIARDVSFWIQDASNFSPNCVYDLIRSVAGDLVETASLVDEFSKDNRQSHCYRVVYRAMDRSLTDEEVNALQSTVRSALTSELRVELR